MIIKTEKISSEEVFMVILTTIIEKIKKMNEIVKNQNYHMILKNIVKDIINEDIIQRNV